MAWPHLALGSPPTYHMPSTTCRRVWSRLVLACVLWQTGILTFLGVEASASPPPTAGNLLALAPQSDSPSASIRLRSPDAFPLPERKPEVIPTPPMISGIAKGRRATAPDMVAEALRLPPGATLFGRSVPLADALASTQGRLRHQDVIRAYWRLAAAIGQYRLCLDECDHLRPVASSRPEDATVLRAARVSAAVAQRNAELDAIRAQRDLSEAAGLSTGLSLPLPADLPHAGPYDTKFQQVYATRTPAPKAYLIDRVLPVRFEAIERRGAAVRAYEGALEVVTDLYAKGQADLPGLLTCLAECGRQRRAFMADVCQYNQDIADYVLTVVGPSTSAQELVTLLIKPVSAAPRKNATEPDPDGPTPAPPRRPTAPGSGRSPSSSSPQTRPGTTESAPRGPTVRTVQLQLESPSRSGSSLALYAALATATPAVRAKELCQFLHSQRNPMTQAGKVSQAGEPIALRDCLASVPASLRRQVLDAYWLARQLAAECQTLETQQSQFAQLVPIVMERGSRQGGPVEGLRFGAASLAAEADLCQSRTRLLEAQFELTRLLGRPLAKDWLLPITPPHAGPYLLKLDAQPRQLAESPPVQRLAKVIHALSEESLQQRATAVVEADGARAVATAAYQTGTRPVDHLLPCIQQQTMETLSLLEILTAYNRAIADYVLTVVSEAMPADQLVERLVLPN
jgi:hypothetical protein